MRAGAGPGGAQAGPTPHPLGLSLPEPPTLHPPLVAADLPGAGALRAAFSTPFWGLFFQQLFFFLRGSSGACSVQRSSSGALPVGLSYSPSLLSQDIPPPTHFQRPPSKTGSSILQVSLKKVRLSFNKNEERTVGRAGREV